MKIIKILLSLFIAFFSPYVVFASMISGTVYSDDGVTQATSTIKLVVNGTTAYATTTDANGAYAISVTDPIAGTPVTAWMDNSNGITGAVVTRFNSGNITGLDIYKNELIVRHEDAGPLVNSDIGACDSVNGSACASQNLHMSVSGGNLTLLSDWGLYVWSGKSFQPGGQLPLKQEQFHLVLEEILNGALLLRHFLF